MALIGAPSLRLRQALCTAALATAFVVMPPGLASGTPDDGTWTSFVPAGFPTAEKALAAADLAGHRLYLYGPRRHPSEGDENNETYVLELASTPPVFRRLSVVGPRPARRADAAMVFDPVRQRLLLIGGWSAVEPITTTEVWELSLGDSPRWRRINPLGTAPGPRRSHVAIYDPIRDRVIVHGGRNGLYLLDDTWALDLSPEPSWTRLTTAGAEPPALSGGTSTYDSRRDRILIFGGRSRDQWNRLVWTLTLSGLPTWSLVTTQDEAPPSANEAYGHEAVYDSVADRMYVIHSEYIPSPPTALGQRVSQLDLAAGNLWSAVPTNGADPALRFESSVGWFPSDRRIVTVGGRLLTVFQSDAHALDVDTRSWIDLEPIGAMPPWSLERSVGTLDSTRSRAFVVARQSDRPPEVWVLNLDGTAWQRPVPAVPLPDGVVIHQVVFDSADDRVLAIASETGSATLTAWEMRPDPRPAWTRILASNPGPSFRTLTSAVFDPVRRRILMFGGATYAFPAGPYNDLWELRLDPTPRWNLLSSSGPTPRAGVSLAYDVAGDQLLMFGGVYGGSENDNLWTWPLATDAGWIPLPSSGSTPMGRTDGALVYDRARSRFVYGGGGSRETWALVLAPDPVWTRLQVEGSTDNPPIGPGVLDVGHDRLVFPLPHYSDGVALQWGSLAAAELSCPPVGEWSPGSIRNVSFTLTDRAGLSTAYEYELTCQRDWPGFPILGLISVGNFSTGQASIGIPMPDTAAFGSLQFDLQAKPSGQPGLESTCSFRLTGGPPPLVPMAADAFPDRAVLRWRTERPNLTVTVARRDGDSGPWTPRAQRTVTTPGIVIYEDRAIEPGRRYDYRLELSDPAFGGAYGMVRLDVPAWSFGFAADQPNPVVGRFMVQCLVSGPGDARLEVFDVRGRLAFRGTRSVAASGRVTFDLDGGRRMASGVYFLRFSQGNLTRQKTVVLLGS